MNREMVHLPFSFFGIPKIVHVIFDHLIFFFTIAIMPPVCGRLAAMMTAPWRLEAIAALPSCLLISQIVQI
jgi:hypothetical protein